MTIQHTPRFGFPYPQRADTSDVPRDVGALAASLETLLNQLIPIGALHLWTAAAAPTGWLLCDGSPYSRTNPTYSALFAVIGTTYGPGDGSTTFNVPDFRGRTIVGFGQGTGLTNRVLATASGEEGHVLSSGEMPAHAHTINNAPTGVTVNAAATGVGVASAAAVIQNPSHTHDLGGALPSHANYNGWSGATNVQQSGGSTNNIPYNNNTAVASVNTSLGATQGSYDSGHAHNINDPSHGHGITDPQHAHGMQNTGGGATHNNMQPFLVVNHIIRYQ